MADESQSFVDSTGESHAIGQEDEGDISTEILIVVFLLMLASTAGQFLKKSGHKYLQESGLTVIIGMIAGFAFRMMKVSYYLESLTAHFSSIFVLVLLPPIIFESGYNMNKKYFMKNVGSILMFSFLGTFIAVFSTSFMVWGFGEVGVSHKFTWQEAFAFGSLISATDPVSVLAIFSEMDADHDLYASIFGESIFNDAISIVLYNIVMEASATSESFGQEVLSGLIAFFLIFTGSLFIGGVFALLIAFILKRQSSYLYESNTTRGFTQRQKTLVAKQSVMTEISMMMLCPAVAYFIASGLGLSGIVSILTNGVLLNYYAKPNISLAARKIIKMLYEVIAHGSETIVFLFLGIGLFAIETPFQTMGFGMFITTVLNLNVARFLNIGIISFLVNLQRSEKSKLRLKTQFVMWFSGLRGAMAYALALQAATELAIGPVILITTLVYSLITILGFGSVLHPILSAMDVKNKPKLMGEQDEQTNNCNNRIKASLSRFDVNYFAPLFIKDSRNYDHQYLSNRSDSLFGQELQPKGNYLGQGYTSMSSLDGPIDTIEVEE